jgi:hypothetical protein
MRAYTPWEICQYQCSTTSTSDTSPHRWPSSTARWAQSSSRPQPPPSSNTSTKSHASRTSKGSASTSPATSPAARKVLGGGRGPGHRSGRSGRYPRQRSACRATRSSWPRPPSSLDPRTFVVRIRPCGRFDSSKSAPSGWQLAEPITTVITDALPRATEGSATRAPSSPPSLSMCSTLTCRFQDVARWISVAGCITVVGLGSFPKPRPADDHHREPPRELNGRDAPLEKNPIVTQFVTQGHRTSIAHSL